MTIKEDNLIFSNNNFHFEEIIYKRYEELKDLYEEKIIETSNERYYELSKTEEKEIKEIKLMIQVNFNRYYYDSKTQELIIGTANESVSNIFYNCIVEYKDIFKDGIKIIEINIKDNENEYIFIRTIYDGRTDFKVRSECMIRYENLNMILEKKNKIKNILLLLN